MARKSNRKGCQYETTFNMSLKEIAAVEKVSTQRIDQIIKEALTKLRRKSVMNLLRYY